VVYTIEQLTELIAPVALKYRLPAVYIFGSYAKGEASDSSDVDILVDRTGAQLGSLLEMGGLYNDLSEAIGKSIDLITVDALDQPDVQRRTPGFKEHLYEERITVYGQQ